MNKEAFERARSAYGTGAYDDATLEFLFPQLKESEEERNERMRKRVIESLVCYRGKVYDEGDKVVASMVDEEIIWMRKQKEKPKSADSIPSDCVSDAKCEDRWHKVEDFLPDNPREVLCKDEAGNYFIGRYYVGEGWEISNYDDEDKPHHLNPPVSRWIDFPSEKQKEQKPINSFDIVPYIDDKIAALQDMWREEKVAFDWDDMHEMIEDVARHFYQKEQKQEWSEEDEKKIHFLSRLIEFQVKDDKYCFGDGSLISKQEAIEMLKSLRPSWRPSEEDIKMLEHIIGQYETGNKNRKVMGYLPRVEELSFLKNVLSKWKN